MTKAFCPASKTGRRTGRLPRERRKNEQDEIERRGAAVGSCLAAGRAGCLRAEHGAACGQRCCARPKARRKAGGGAPVPPSQSAPADEPEPAGAAGQALSEEELDSLWQALGLGQSAWWCADDESVTWGGLGWPAFWVSQQQDGGRSVKYGSAWGPA